ncbi:hypothetical protein [Pseudomonas faucium]|uniref:hypothetical protein n=1 Tax=Pseudomonas faucium TaxID=2740518 RepID=UPI001F463B83|nr:hypothetical protein [Pseudomonas faucium]
MSDDKHKPILHVCVEEVSKNIQLIVGKLPAESGAVLNFGADVLAVLMMCFLAGAGILPQDQILSSLVAVLVFMLLCATGVMFVILANRSRPS